jgi:Uma2 family endonuclease
LLDTWRELQVREGWRPQPTVEGIHLTPPPVLAVEITSKNNGGHDRKKGCWAYAHGPIPRYLLIDQFDEDGAAESLFAEPLDGVYGKTIRVPFGKPIDIGEPFGTALDTSRF